MTKKNGWKIKEREELISSIIDAKKNNIPLSKIFQTFAINNNRKANSVRNYYYTIINKGDNAFPAFLTKSKIVAFSTSECDELLRKILSLCAGGLSVRRAISTIAQNKTQMLRLQNKFRNLLKYNKETVLKIMEEQKLSGRYYDPYEKTIILFNVEKENNRIFPASSPNQINSQNG